MAELKPCPFCGGEAVLSGSEYTYVYCKKCGAESHGGKSRAKTVEQWNRRVGDDLTERNADNGTQTR